MYKQKKIIAIIPARSGSKGIKDKNIKLLNNKPLIHYSINAAKNSKFIDSIIVSTDSKKYADIALNCGAEVPFLRSKKNSSDHAPTIEVIVEVFKKLEKKKRKYDLVVVLQPTSPLRTSKNIDKAISYFFKKKANAVVSVNKLKKPIYWANKLPPNLSMKDFIKTKDNLPRQMIQDFFILNGAITIINSSCLKNNYNIYQDTTFAFVMDEKNSIDIDSDLDFALSEFLLSKIQN